MTVNTAKVAERRSLRFTSLSEVLAEAERLAAASPEMLGNWTLGQTFAHLGRAMDIAVDGAPFGAPWIIRLIGPWLKNWMLRRPMSAGFKLPKDAASALIPPALGVDEGLAALRHSIERFERGPKLKRHDILGPMSDDDWLQLQLRHAELHLSFAKTSP